MKKTLAKFWSVTSHEPLPQALLSSEDTGKNGRPVPARILSYSKELTKATTYGLKQQGVAPPPTTTSHARTSVTHHNGAGEDNGIEAHSSVKSTLIPVSTVVPLVENSSMCSIPNSTSHSCLTDSERIKIGQIYFALHIIILVGQPLILIMGFVGNTLSFLAMTRKWNRSNSTCILIACLSVVDSLVLLLVFVGYLPKTGMLSYDYCKASYLFQVFSLSSTWILTFMTTQRVIVLYRPMQRNAITEDIKLTGKIVVGIVVGALIWSMPIPVVIESIKPFVDKLVILCVSRFQINLYYRIYSAFGSVISSWLPFVMILGCNIAIVVKIRDIAKEQARLRLPIQNERSTNKMLLFVSFAFLILVAPSRVTSLLNNFLKFESPVDKAIMDLITSISYNMLFMNHATNFFLYIAGGGKKFKSDLRSVLSSSTRIHPV
jgi:hypothetical protein